MPNISLNFDVTQAQLNKLNRWFARWNPQQPEPFDTIEDALKSFLVNTAKDFMRDESLLRLPEVPNALVAATEAEQDQIMAILENYMVGG